MSHLDKTNNVPVRPAKTQISLGIRPVWSESLLSLATHWAHSEVSDQTGRMPRLIWVIAGCTCHFVGFVMGWLKSPLYNLIIFINQTDFFTGFEGGEQHLTEGVPADAAVLSRQRTVWHGQEPVVCWCLWKTRWVMTDKTQSCRSACAYMQVALVQR